MPVSSSRLRKTKPLAVPGRWRAMTDPAMRVVRPWGRCGEFAGGGDANPFQFGAMKGHGMFADGDSGAGEVGDQALFDGHLLQRRFGGFRRHLIQQGSGGAACVLYLPERVAAVGSHICQGGFAAGYAATDAAPAAGAGQIWAT